MNGHSAAECVGWTRRNWLASLSLLAFGTLGADEPEKRGGDSAKEDAIRAIGEKTGLKKFGTSHSAHYIGIGDAPTKFREEALKLCETLATTYQKHFQEKGFETKLPTEAMTAVILANRKSYASFKGEDVGEEEGAYYDVEANRLVMFDSGKAGARVNTFTLVHEAMHQLTFATGLLSHDGDVPLAVSEGLAAYGELWRLKDPKMGQINSLRMTALTAPGAVWIPIDRLLADDEFFSGPDTQQVAYAEAWLFIHTYMLARGAAQKGKLRTYLAAIRERKDASKRMADAEAAFGDLGKLDRELKKAARLK